MGIEEGGDQVWVLGGGDGGFGFMRGVGVSSLSCYCWECGLG